VDSREPARQVARCLHNIERFAAYKPGFRRAHARGFAFGGHFVATPDAARLTTAEHMSGRRIEVVARLSNGGVDPYAPDRSSERRGAVMGLAVRFALPSGAPAEWVAISISRFPPRKPEDFIEFVSASRPGRVAGLPNPLRLGAFLAWRPQAIAGTMAIATAPAPDSFATAEYHGLNAYYAVDAQGVRRPFRYTWKPTLERRPLSAEDERVLPPQYLISELKCRLERAPVSWDLVLQLAEENDVIDDMTKVWPDDRPLVTAGRLVLERVLKDQASVERSMFDPTNVPPGIEISDDPILAFRSRVYRESRFRRAAEGQPTVEPQ
jgi:catalase